MKEIGGYIELDRYNGKMLHDDGICAGDDETTGNFSFIDCTRFGTCSRLDVYAFVINDHMFMERVLLFAEMSTDHAFLNGPRETSFVRFKTSGK